MRLPLSWIVRPPGEAWQQIGRGYAPGILPESSGFGFELPGGSAGAGFRVQRDARLQWPDLTSGAPAACLIGSTPVWSGQVHEASANRGDASIIDVALKGWVRHLQEDVSFAKLWTHQGTAGWQDVRDLATTSPSTYQQSYAVEIAERGIISLGIGGGATVVTGSGCAVTLDAGPGNTLKRFCGTYVVGAGTGNLTLNVRSENTPTDLAEVVTIDAAPLASASFDVTFATARRYVTLAMINNSGGTLTGVATSWVQFTDLTVASASAYLAAGAFTFPGSTLAADLVTNAGSLLSTDVSGIAATATNIPNMGTDGFESFFDLLQRALSWDAPDWWTSPNLSPTLKVQARASAPTWVADVSDDTGNTSSDTISDIYNRVRIRWRNASGIEQSTVVPLSPDTTILAKLGSTRTADLEIRRAVADATSVSAIGAAFLAVYSRAPAKNTLKLKDTVRGVGGGAYPVAYVKGGDVVLMPQARAAEGGPRKGVVVSGEYDHDSLTMGVTFDSARGVFDRGLARFEATGRWAA